jgi:hypothetical protein
VAVRAVVVIGLVIGLGCACDRSPDRNELVGLAKQGDPTLDDARAGCVVDGLVARLGADRTASALRTRTPDTLSGPDTDAVTAVGMSCSGAPGVAAPPS